MDSLRAIEGLCVTQVVLRRTPEASDETPP